MPAPSPHAVVAALADPAFYPHRPEAVEHVQTHISHVFLAGPWVYKLKKPVRFPFLDFSTLERRRHFCEEEVRLNRRLCPDLYRGVLPITRAAGGRLALDGEGEPVDHVVWMRRLPAERILARLLARGEVGAPLVDAVAARMAAFHATAPTGPDIAAHAAPERLREVVLDAVALGARFAGRLLPAEDHEVLQDFGPTFIRRHETLLRARQQADRIRDGHGDLHAEHVCVVDAPLPADDLPPLAPGLYVFDCIEFSPGLRAVDVASEMAFLAMDLEARGHPGLARRLVTAYAAAADDPDVETLVPLYACHRACVRGGVEALASEEAEVDEAERRAAAARARDRFALALRYAWGAAGPAVIACAGLAGTGKSTLAHALGAATGFRIVSSDVVRKRDAAGSVCYTPAARAAVYGALLREVEAALAAGEAVIADATFIRRADRDALRAAARAARRPCVFVECVAGVDAVRERLAAREGTASLSDARWGTYVAQRASADPFGEDEARVVVDTGGEVAAARAAAVRALWRWRQGRPVAGALG